MRNQRALLAGALLVAIAAPACAQDREDEAAREPTREPRNGRATSAYDIRGLDGDVIGRAELLDGPRGLLLKVSVDGLAPGEHGLHVHEIGACEPPFASAGGHYDPEASTHGFLSDRGPHAGDLPNLIVVGPSRSVGHAYAHGLSIAELLDGDGSALVIHAGADDYRTDPAGAAGERVACAEIVER